MEVVEEEERCEEQSGSLYRNWLEALGLFL